MPDQDPLQSSSTKRSPLRWIGWIFGLALIALIVVIGVWYGRVHALRARGLTFLADVFLVTPRPEERVRQLTPGDGIYHFGTLRPDASRVVYEGGREGCVRLWEMDLATDAVEPITPDDSAALHPNYSWDGKQIVFVSDRATDQDPLQINELPIKGMYNGHRFHLFIMDAETHETRQLTSGPSGDYRPSFSPDGKTIVFGSTRGGRGGYRIYTLPADGSAEPEAIAFKGFGYNPWYAADGKTIFFHTWKNGRDWMLRYTPGDPEPVRLPEDDFFRTHGAFADPHGEVLMVHAMYQDENWGMWEIPLDGSPKRRYQFEGLEWGMHGARALDGTLTFDLERGIWFENEFRWWLDRLRD